jgi:hypothetical protein
MEEEKKIYRKKHFVPEKKGERKKVEVGHFLFT